MKAKLYILIACVLMVKISAFGATFWTQLDQPSDTVYYFTDKAAEFVGGEEGLSRYIARNLRYPKQAREMGLQARIFVRFVVNSSGLITSPKILNPTRTVLDEEAVRLVSSMPAWQPGSQKGKAVAVYVTVPIAFKLN